VIVSLSMVALVGGMSAANARQPESEAFGPFSFTGEVVTDCGDFEVLNDATYSFVQTSYFDKSGNVVRQLVFETWSESIYYRSDGIGPILTGQVEKNQNRINFIKDENLLILNDHGYMIKPPHGGVVFLDSSRIIFDLASNEIVSLKGRYDGFSEDAHNRFCAAFRQP